jgi:hypothetical protein
MNTTITTTIPVDVCEKIKLKRWAYNDLILLGIQAIEEDWKNQIAELEDGNFKLQAKLTEIAQKVTE